MSWRTVKLESSLSPRLFARRAFLVGCLVCAAVTRIDAGNLFQTAPVAESAPQVAALPADYREFVQQYVSGDHDEALAFLGNWNDERLRLQIKRLKEVVVTIRSCAQCPERQAFVRFPLRAAILLHGDREIQQEFRPPTNEQPPTCGVGLSAEAIVHLSAILKLVDPKAGEFLRPFYLGMSRQARWSHCSVESALWARSGLRMYPNDVPLTMALGVALETGAFFTLAPSPSTPAGGAVLARQGAQLKMQIHSLEEGARQAFEKAARADPNLAEAKVRLGRVQWRLGMRDAARTTLEASLKIGDADSHYLSHLFLGRVLEEASKWTEAETHYRAAIALQPLAETPFVALSHVLFLQGDPEGAREALVTGLEATRHRITYDPWLPYLVTQTNDGETLLAELRRGLSQ